MNCVIPGANMKFFGKAVQALSKVGDELQLEAMPDYLILRAANMTTTAYCTFKFHDSFFADYELEGKETECVVSMKALLGVFKQHGHKDKKPEVFKIELNTQTNRIIFTLRYKHDVIVVRSLHLSEGQVVSVTYNSTTSNQIGAASQLFTQVLSNFQLGDEDVSFDVTRSKASMRNYITGDINKPKGIRSQITLRAGEFALFKIEQDTSITCSLKPFRAAVQFAEAFNLSISLNFEKSGRPLILIIRSTTFEADFVIATLKGDQSTQSTMSTLVFKRKAQSDKLNLTVQDQEALDSVNWDNDFDSQPKETNENPFTNIIKKRKGLEIKKAKGPEIKKGKEPEINNHVNNNTENERIPDDGDKDIINSPPESPSSKRIKTIFGRCYDTTFHTTMADLGDILVPDSDPDSD